MLNRLIGKNVEITAAFATSISTGGPAPVSYYGIIKEIDEEYVALSLGYKIPVCAAYNAINFNPIQGENCSGDIYIKKEYILTCRELPQ